MLADAGTNSTAAVLTLVVPLALLVVVLALWWRALRSRRGAAVEAPGTDDPGRGPTEPSPLAAVALVPALGLSPKLAVALAIPALASWWRAARRARP